jgi:hypothetical protein
MRPMNLPSGRNLPDPEKRKAGLIVRPQFDKTPQLVRAFSSPEPGAIMRQQRVEIQPFEQQFWWFSNEHAETPRIV